MCAWSTGLLHDVFEAGKRDGGSEGRSHSSLWRSAFCWPQYVPVYHPRFEPLLERSSEVWACVPLFQEGRVMNAVKAAGDSCIEHVSGLYLYCFPYLLHRIVA